MAFGPSSLAPIAGTVAFTREMAEAGERSDALAEQVVARALEAGVLRSDVTTFDVVLVVEQFSRRPPVSTDQDSNARERLVAIVLDGLKARPDTADSPLPGHPPTADRYAQLWNKG